MRKILAIGIVALLLTWGTAAMIPSKIPLPIPSKKDFADESDDTSVFSWPTFAHDMKRTGRIACDTSKNPGKIKWSFDLNDWAGDSPAISEDGTIYFGSLDHHLYAIYPNGTKKWDVDLHGYVECNPTIGKNGTIYVGSENGRLYAINPNGTIKWSFLTSKDSPIVTSPAIDENGIIYFGSFNKRFYALYPTGTVKWSLKFDVPVSAGRSPAAIGNDGTIYMQTTYPWSWGKMWAIYPNGTIKWMVRIDGGFFHPVIGEDGTIYAGSYDHCLYALNPNGTLKWRYFSECLAFFSPALGKDGTLYVSDSSENLYALHPNGTCKWKIKNPEREHFGGVAIGGDGTIYTEDNRRVYAITPDGKIKWQCSVNADYILWPAIGGDGTVYVTTQICNSSGFFGKLYAIGGIKIEKPEQGYLYIGNRQIFPTRSGNTIIIGKISIEVNAFHEENVNKIEFYLDDRLVETDNAAPFKMTIDETAFWKHTIKAKAYYEDETTPTDEMDVIIFNI
jgi:outer membrane protein assembly factor BamB